MFLEENKAGGRPVILLVWLSSLVASSYGNCGVPPKLDGATLEDQFVGQNDFPVDATVSYVCSRGYTRNSSIKNSISCLSDSTWSTAETFCQRRSCGDPGDTPNGDVHFVDVLFGSRATYTCHTGYRLLTKNYRECQADGTWSNQVPVCEVQICEPPDPITDGSFDPVKEEYTYQDAVTYQCNDKKYALKGDSSMYCTAGGNWSSNAPECVVVICPSPEVENAARVSGFTGPYYYKYAVRFECSPGFTMKGANLVECNIRSQWDPPLPTCSKTNVAAVMEYNIILFTMILLGHLLNPLV